MSVQQNFKYSDDTTMESVIVVAKDEYQKFSNKIIEQLAKNVEVKGFRKGKAPLDKAMAKMDMQSAQNTVLNESLAKFVDPNLKPAQEKLMQDKRSIFKTELKDVKALDNGDMQFTAEMYLTPAFDMKKIYAFKLPEVKEDDMPVRFSKKEYMDKGKNEFVASYNEFDQETKKVDNLTKVKARMTMKLGESAESNPESTQEIEVVIGTRSCPSEFTTDLMGKKIGDKVKTQTSFNLGMASPINIPVEIEILELSNPKYKTLAEILENNPEAKAKFASEKDLDKQLESVYDQETESITQEIQFRKVIKEIQKSLLSYHFVPERFNQDGVVERTKEDAKKQGLDWVEYLKLQNILEGDKKYTEETAKAALLEVFKSEELYLQLLRNIYDFELPKKITEKEVEDTIRSLRENQHKGHNHSLEEYQKMALDHLVRSKALNYLLQKIQENSKVETSKKVKTEK